MGYVEGITHNYVRHGTTTLFDHRAGHPPQFVRQRARAQAADHLFVQRYNADASPFQWVATTDSILQKIERIAKRISATGH